MLLSVFTEYPVVAHIVLVLFVVLLVLAHCQRMALNYHVDDLQHKGTMSTKPVFEKITKLQKSCVPLCGHATCGFDTGTYCDCY